MESVEGSQCCSCCTRVLPTLNRTAYERCLANEVLKSKQLKHLELELLTHSTPSSFVVLYQAVDIPRMLSRITAAPVPLVFSKTRLVCLIKSTEAG